MEDSEGAHDLAIGDDVSGSAGEVGGVITLADVVTIAARILKMAFVFRSYLSYQA